MKRKMLTMALLLGFFQATNAQRQMSAQELLDLAEKGNSKIRVEQTRLENSKNAVETAKAQRLPDLNAEVSASLNGNVVMLDRNFGNANTFSQPRWGNSLNVEAQQIIYAGGVINSSIRVAELAEQMAENNLLDTRNNVKYGALAQYLQILKLDNGIQVYSENIRLTEQLLDHIKAKQQQGMALKNDVTRYELQLQNLNLGKRKLEDARSVVNYQLCNNLGIQNERIIPEPGIIENSYAQDGLDEWLSASSQSSIALKNIQIASQMAEEKITMVKSDLRPKVAMVAVDNLSGPYNYDIPPINNNFNICYLGVAVRYQIGNLWKSNHKISQARTSLRELQETEKSVSENVSNQVQDAYTLYIQAFAELETQQESVRLASENYNVVSDRYANQLALITDMLDATNMKLMAELGEVDAKINIALAYYKLKLVSGSGF